MNLDALIGRPCRVAASWRIGDGNTRRHDPPTEYAEIAGYNETEEGIRLLLLATDGTPATAALASLRWVGPVSRQALGAGGSPGSAVSGARPSARFETEPAGHRAWATVRDALAYVHAERCPAVKWTGHTPPPGFAEVAQRHKPAEIAGIVQDYARIVDAYTPTPGAKDTDDPAHWYRFAWLFGPKVWDGVLDAVQALRLQPEPRKRGPLERLIGGDA